VCCDPGKPNPDHLARTAESYRALAAYALLKGVRVVVENQESFGADHPEDMVRLFKLAGAGSIGALPNFSNFPDEPTREKGLRLLLPYAASVCRVGRVAAGESAQDYDLPKAMEMARKAGFRGVYTIVFDGPGDPYAGIQKMLDEILKYL
jgi:sugar phosphate isomerase/epimerase